MNCLHLFDFAKVFTITFFDRIKLNFSFGPSWKWKVIMVANWRTFQCVLHIWLFDSIIPPAEFEGRIWDNPGLKMSAGAVVLIITFYLQLGNMYIDRVMWTIIIKNIEKHRFARFWDVGSSCLEWNLWLLFFFIFVQTAQQELWNTKIVMRHEFHSIRRNWTIEL